MEWTSATIDEVKKIIEADLKNCDKEQIATFESYAVQPYRAPILRYEKLESVVVVARRGTEVMYWDDVEEGFNISRVAEDGMVVDSGANQDDLAVALSAWRKPQAPGR